MSSNTYDVALAAGTEVPLFTNGNYYRVLSASGDLFVAVGDGMLEARSQGIGQHVDAGFSKLRLYSATAQTVRIATAIGRIDDNRLAVTTEIQIRKGTRIFSGRKMYTSFGITTVVTLLPQDTQRRALTIQNNLNNLLQLFGTDWSPDPPSYTDLSANGWPLQVGDAITITEAASSAIYAYSASPSAGMVNYLEELQ